MNRARTGTPFRQSTWARLAVAGVTTVAVTGLTPPSPLDDLIGPTAAGAAVDACAVDTGFGSGGRVVVDAMPGEHQLDRFELASDGTLVAIGRRVVDDSHIEDVVRRFNVDGSLDTTFGGGTVVLEPAFYANGRNVAIGPDGKLWVTRAPYRNVFEMLRFLPDGRPDPTMPRMFDVLGSSTDVGPVGSIQVESATRARAIYGYIQDVDNPKARRAAHVIDGTSNFRQVDSNLQFQQFAFAIDQAGEFELWATPQNGDIPAASRIFPSTAASPFGPPLFQTSAANYADLALVEITIDNLSHRGPFFVGNTLPAESAQLEARFVSDFEAPFGRSALDVGADSVADFGVAATPSGDAISVDADGAAWATTFDLSDGSVLDSYQILPAGSVTAAYPAAIVEDDRGVWTVALWTAPFGSDRVTIVRGGVDAIERIRGGALSAQIQRLYTAYFRRIPHADEARFWAERRSIGWSADDVSEFFADSPEFVETYGALGSTAFVDLVYQNVLGRPADPSGRAHWVQQLESGGLSRGAMMRRFSDSPEYLGRFNTHEPPHGSAEGRVHRLYRAYFGRDADEQGFCYWVRRLDRNASLETISSAFAGSAEFRQTYGALDDGEFVDLVYENVLERAPDPSGRAYWVGRLDDGSLTRGELMIGFSESVEYILATDTIP